MVNRTKVKQLIRDVFKEEALVIGGMVADHQIDDEAVWQLTRHMDAIRIKTLRRIDEESPKDEWDERFEEMNLRPHPAIEEFLSKLRMAEQTI